MPSTGPKTSRTIVYHREFSVEKWVEIFLPCERMDRLVNFWLTKGVHLAPSSRKTLSPVAQLVEQVAVNHLVTGSSPVGGARFFSTERNPTPVNARRREIGCRAFCVSGQFWQGFATIPPPASRSLFRERTFGVRKGPSRYLPHPGISRQNSRSL